MNSTRLSQCTCQFGSSKFDKKDNKTEEGFTKRIRMDNVENVISIWPPSERDRISELSDDIPAKIVSCLTLKEAASTSVLSTRWRHLWTLYTGCFDFDESLTAMDLLFHLDLGSQPLHIERHWFVSWVNKVLGSHQGPTVEELRTCFDLDSNSDIDNWMNFAIQKRVRRLELNLTSSKRCVMDWRYSFPTHSNSTSLTSLYLIFVNVTGENLEYLLCNCPFLEELGVFYSFRLKVFKVSSPSLKLKHLEVGHCYFLHDLEISAVNLMLLRYHGDKKINVALKNFTSLLVVSFGRLYCEYIIHNLCQLSSYLLRLHMLKLDLTLLDCVNPSPGKEWNFTKDHRYHSLKVVDMVGFVAHTADVGFVMYLLDNATLLEKVIIDPCKPKFRGSPSELLYRETKEYLSARECAVELGAKLPLWEFVIL